jgi:hypothetical protein
MNQLHRRIALRRDDSATVCGFSFSLISEYSNYQDGRVQIKRHMRESLNRISGISALLKVAYFMLVIARL